MMAVRAVRWSRRHPSSSLLLRWPLPRFSRCAEKPASADRGGHMRALITPRAVMPAESTTASARWFDVNSSRGICASTPSAWLLPISVANRVTLRDLTHVAQYTVPPASPMRKNPTAPVHAITNGDDAKAMPIRHATPRTVTAPMNTGRAFSPTKRFLRGKASRPRVLAPWMGSCERRDPGSPG